jgi:CubicO group peptidase (beta-lactamase class C family)/uncharacterized protein YciI
MKKHLALLATFFLSTIITTGQNLNPAYDSTLAKTLGADDYGMKWYVLAILKTGSRDIEDRSKRDSLFAGHLANINRLAGLGKLVVAGPLGKNDHNYRGIFILDVSDLEEAGKLLQTDPTIKEKLLEAELFRWYGSAALPEYLRTHRKIDKTATTYTQYLDTVSLARFIPRLMESGDIPGLSAATIIDGRVAWLYAGGTLNDSLRTPVDRHTIFPAASLSKPVFAYVVLRLAERGEFDLDQPLCELLDYPRLAHDERHRRITARMVLSHGTGLPNWGGERLDLNFDPGEGFNYSGEGFVYLQKAVEATSGMTLEELARREVFEPLGMVRSSFVWQERFEGNAVYGKDWAWRVNHLPRYAEPNAAYSLLTTAEDYGRFIAAIIDPTGLTPRYRDEMLRPARPARWQGQSSPVAEHIFWGLGWGLQQSEEETAFWHWGDNGPFKAFVIAYPARGIGMAYFANSHDGLSVAEDLSASVLTDKPLALQWLNYTPHDDPRRQLLRSLRSVATARGETALLLSYRSLREKSGSRLDIDEAGNLSDFLFANGLDSAALRVLSLAAEDYPDSLRAFERLAEAFLNQKNYAEGIATLRRALGIAPDNEDVRRRIEWIELRTVAAKSPITLEAKQLKRYAGQYGPRRVRLEGERLYYQREGNQEYALTPLSENMFALEGLETFRVLFALEGEGPSSRITGLYINGGTDENERTK